MNFDDVVFMGNEDGMTLYGRLFEYARNNDIHEDEDFDIVCHCDFCQVFLPMAEKMERFIAQAEAVGFGVFGEAEARHALTGE